MEQPMVNQKCKWKYMNFANNSNSLSIIELGLYQYLINRLSQDGHTFVKMDELTTRFNLNENQINKVIKGLTDKGFIVYIKPKKGIWHNFYFVEPDVIIRQRNIDVNNFAIYQYTSLKATTKPYLLFDQQEQEEELTLDDELFV